MDGERGLTLLEVVVALLLFSIMSVMMLGGHGRAADASLKAEIARDMAELLSLRLNLVALQHDEYEDGDEGGFPQSRASTRLVDEEEIFGDLYEGYRWSVEIQETIASGAGGAVSVGGGDPRNLLFDEEGTGAADDEEEAEVEVEEVDRMLFIRVTVYPPNYDESEADLEGAVQPRSIWTAVHLAPEETEDEGG